MSPSSSTAGKVVGLALLVAGIGLAFWGYQLSTAVTAKLARVMTGALPDAVMYRYIGGAVCGAAGIFLLFRR